MRLEVDGIGLSRDGEPDALFAVGPVGRDDDDFSAGFSIRSASRSSSLNVVPHARHGTDPARGVAYLASGDIVASPVRLYDSPAVRDSVWYDPLTSTPNAAKPSRAQSVETVEAQGCWESTLIPTFSFIYNLYFFCIAYGNRSSLHLLNSMSFGDCSRGRR